VRDNFKGIFFAEGVHAVIDQIRANCDDLAGYKKDIALFCLGKTCLGGKGGFGHFSASTVSSGHQDNPDEFRERFRKNAKRINGLIFDNGEENKAYRDDINQILPKVKADLAYFDPPYATEYSTTNYEKFYHFIEGLMTYWEGLKIKSDTKVKAYETDHVTVTKANATEFFKGFLGNATHIDHWLISYRDHAYPNEDDMKQIIGDLGRDSQMKTKDHQYSITSQHGEASQAKERLFICRKAAASKSKAEVPAKPKPLVAQANFHTILPVEIQLSEPSPMNAEGMDVSVSGDPQFSFILCRVGTNKNGDHFTAEELSARHMTAVNKKIDLQHSQDVSDIVGGIIAADYLEDTTGGRVECVGELYTRDSQYSQLAYKLMKRGIVSQVSMECDYEEGECSVCGKRFKSKADYCQHLRKFKGQIYNGETVFEILHNVTFTGLGLLDRKGADENARIIQVASTQEPINNQSLQGEKPMEEQTKKEEPSSEAAKKPADNGGGGGSPDTAKVTQLENENKQLRSQVTELQKRIQELEATQKAAASQARAGKLLERLIKQGLEFGDEEAREKELKRLAGLSDEAFAATEAAFELAAKKKTIPPEDEEEEDEDDEEDADADSGKKKKSVPDSKKAKASTKASREGGMRGNASVRPRDVDDRKVSLEDRLRSGFMAAYQERIGQEVEDQENINA
jgi:adenine-specific DNA-methyltransferase